MRCDICDMELANSEALEDHKERAHPMGQGDTSPGQGVEGLENPDEMESDRATDTEPVQPAPVVRPGR